MLQSCHVGIERFRVRPVVLVRGELGGVDEDGKDCKVVAGQRSSDFLVVRRKMYAHESGVGIQRVYEPPSQTRLKRTRTKVNMPI